METKDNFIYIEELGELINLRDVINIYKKDGDESFEIVIEHFNTKEYTFTIGMKEDRDYYFILIVKLLNPTILNLVNKFKL